MAVIDSRHKQIIAEHFDATPFDDDWEPRYNIAPSQPVPVIRENAASKRELSLLRWGLIPSWATDASIGFKSINAKVGVGHNHTPRWRLDKPYLGEHTSTHHVGGPAHTLSRFTPGSQSKGVRTHKKCSRRS